MTEMTRDEKFAAVERLRQEKGMNVPDACKEVGWNASGYYDHKKKSAGKALTVPGRATPKKKHHPEVIHVMEQQEEDDNVTVIVMKGKGATIEKISAALGGVL